MRLAHATVALFAALSLGALPAAADERAAMAAVLGALSIAPQLCGLDIDRQKLNQLVTAAEQDVGPDLGAEVFRVNNALATDSASWSAEARDTWCASQQAAAKTVDVLIN